MLARELSASGADVVDVGRKRVLFSLRANKPRVIFSIMMNRVNDVLAARRLQDRMVQAIAGYDA